MIDISTGKYWDEAWTLVEGCTPVSEGCDRCWAAGIDSRFKKNFKGGHFGGCAKTLDGRYRGVIRCREDNLGLPARTGKPTVWSVWNDLFPENVPDEFIEKAIDQMYANRQHRYLLLTKRAKRMAEFTSRLAVQNGDEFVDRIWFGTTAENQPWLDKRYKDLVEVPGNRFLSLEPLLGEIDLSGCCSRIDGPGLISHGGISDFIHWVIVGAETGPGRRPCPIEWIESVVYQCKEAGVPCWVKAVEVNGKLIKNLDDLPASVRVRELPFETAKPGTSSLK